jgi:membrane-associated phospholipid phosphatase
VLMYGLDLAGVKGRNGWVNQTFIIVMSQAINGALTTAIKELTKIERPDHSNDNSFPSGHTSVSFAMAEVLHQEFKEKSVWISVAGYSVASAVGVMRMLNNRHWLSDVVAGAGFGILSVKLTYLLYPKIQKKVCSQNAQGL